MFEVSLIRLALVASVAASLPLSLLGIHLVIRRVVFLGLVLANAATVGAALAQAAGWPTDAAAVATAVATAFALGALPGPRRVSAESIIGWAYATTAALTVIILAAAARGDADTLHLLYGNVLAVAPRQVLVLVGMAIVVALLQVLFGPRLLLVTVDAEAAQVAGVPTRRWSLALNLSIGVVTAVTVHELGALVTFAMLTLPPMGSLLVSRHLRTVFAFSAAIGIAGAGLGLLAAFRLDLPPGPATVAVLALIVPVMGLIGRWRA